MVGRPKIDQTGYKNTTNMCSLYFFVRNRKKKLFEGFHETLYGKIKTPMKRRNKYVNFIKNNKIKESIIVPKRSNQSSCEVSQCPP